MERFTVRSRRVGADLRSDGAVWCWAASEVGFGKPTSSWSWITLRRSSVETLGFSLASAAMTEPMVASNRSKGCGVYILSHVSHSGNTENFSFGSSELSH